MFEFTEERELKFRFIDFHSGEVVTVAQDEAGILRGAAQAMRNEKKALTVQSGLKAAPSLLRHGDRNVL